MSDVVKILNNEKHFRLSVVGNGGEGKTFLIRCILPHLAKSRLNPGGFSSIYIFGEYVLEDEEPTQQDPYTQVYLDYKRKGCTVTTNFNANHLYRWVQSREKAFKKNKSKSLIVMDDISCYRLHVGKKADFMDHIFSSCRHAGVSIIAVSHAYKVLPPMSRNQSTHIIFTSITGDSYTHLLKDRMNMKRRVTDYKMINMLQPAKNQYLFFNPRALKQFKKFRI